MGFHRDDTRVSVTCDHCGPDWWDDEYQEAPPTFTSRGEALRRLPIDFMWLIEEQPDGSLLMVCMPCAQLELCFRDGHTWVPLEYEIDGEVRRYGQICPCCSTVRSHDVPPAGHPESMTTDLDDADEATLAEIERIEFPEDDDVFAAGIAEALPRLRENGGTR